MVHETPFVEFPWFSPDFGDFYRAYDCFPGANTRQGVAKGQEAWGSTEGPCRRDVADGTASTGRDLDGDGGPSA